MPILTYDHGYISPTLAWDRCRAYIRCSAVNGFIAGDEIIHGDTPSPLDMQGKGSVELVATTANVRYEQVLELWRQGENVRRVWTSGWFEFTEDANLKDLATIDIPGAPTTALGEHIADPSNAHAASAIGFTPAGSVSATDVQAAIEEVAAEVGGTGTGLAAHVADTTDVHGIPDTSALETKSGAQAKADTAQSAAVAAAASDATAKAASAQANAISAAASDATTKANAAASGAAAALDAHKTQTTGSHAATAISYAGGILLPSSTVEAALDTLDARTRYGTGDPNGVVTAPVGTVFRNTEAGGYNGARVWRKDSGAGSTGWVVESGDTGWREMDPVAFGSAWVRSTTAPRFRLRRVGGDVLIEARLQPSETLAGAPRSNRAKLLDLPVGFRFTGIGGSHTPSGIALIISGSTTFIGSNGVVVGNSNALDVSFSPLVTGSWNTTDNVVVSDRFAANDPWPATLPGTPA